MDEICEYAVKKATLVGTDVVSQPILTAVIAGCVAVYEAETQKHVAVMQDANDAQQLELERTRVRQEEDRLALDREIWEGSNGGGD